MKKHGMTTEYKNTIEKAINIAVYKTGYPVTISVLKSINVTRSQIKSLEHEGLVTSVNMILQGQAMKGYYITKGVHPKHLGKITANAS